MICLHCSKEVPAGMKFCIFCGKKIEEQRYCPQCGKEYGAGAIFCPGCGNKLAEETLSEKTFSFFCPKCGQKLEVEESLCGQSAECPSCKQQITIPGRPQDISSRKFNAVNLETSQIKDGASSGYDSRTINLQNYAFLEDTISGLSQPRSLFLTFILSIVTLGIYNIFLVLSWVKDLNLIHKQNHFNPYSLPIFFGVTHVVFFLLSVSSIELGFWGDLFSSLILSFVTCIVLYIIYDSLMRSVSDFQMIAKLAVGRGILLGLFLLNFLSDFFMTLLLNAPAQENPDFIEAIFTLFFFLLGVSISIAPFLVIQHFFNSIIENQRKDAVKR